MKLILSSFFIFLLSLTKAQSEYYVSLGNADDKMLLLEGSVGFERANAYVFKTNRLPISQNYFTGRLKAEYGLFHRFKLGTELNTRNLSVQNGAFGAKYEIPLATKYVLKNDNSMTMVIVPEVDFLFPLWMYETESEVAIGNRNMGFQFGSTFWIPVYRINLDMKLYGGYNLFFNPVPNAMQFQGQIGKIVKAFYPAVFYQYQKSFGTENYFDGIFDTYRQLPISYHKAGVLVNYLREYKWEAGLRGTYLFAGSNVRRAWGIEGKFTLFLNFGRGY